MKEQFTLFVGEGAWRVAVVRDRQATIHPLTMAPDASLAIRVETARQQLGTLGHTGQPVMLAIPSTWCLCATISTENLERSGRHRAMAFRLEEHLPLSAEEAVTDFLDLGGSTALGVCARLSHLQSLVSALESAGIPVRHISPAALLAAGWVIGQHPEIDAVLDRCEEGEGADSAGYDLIELTRQRPTHWWWLASDDGATRERLQNLAAEREGKLRLATVGLDETSLGLDRGMAGIEHVPMRSVDDDQAAALHAAGILDGTAAPWIDFRRDQLAAPDSFQIYRRPLAWLAAAAVLLLVGLIAITQWRGRQYEALGLEYADKQADVFKSAMPNQRVPISIKARLLSEKQRLSGLGGKGTGDESTGDLETDSALIHLRALLASLPQDVRCRILDLTIQPDLIRIDGQAQSHVDAERITAALRDTGLFEVEPPKTQALKDRGVSFAFTAKPREAPAQAKGGP